MTTSFPVNKNDSGGIFILRMLNCLYKVEHDVVVPLDRFNLVNSKSNGCLQNGEVHTVRYTLLKGNIVSESNFHGGFPDAFNKRPWVFILYPLMLFAMFREVLRLIGNNSIVHVHWLPNGLIGVLVKKLKNVPIVITLRGSDQKLIDLKILRPLWQWILSEADAVTTVSQTLANRVTNEFSLQKKTFFIPNGVDITVKKEKKDNSDFKLIFVGSLTHNKNVNLLLLALTNLSHRGDIKLTIIGDGPERESLLNYVQKNGLIEFVHFHGIAPPSEVTKIMSNHDCLVLPSQSEGMPNVVKEAMACSLTVIATNVGGVPELITHGEQGLLFKPGDERALTAYIELLAEDREKAKAMGKEGRKLIIEKNLTWENTAKQYLNVYRRISS